MSLNSQKRSTGLVTLNVMRKLEEALSALLASKDKKDFTVSICTRRSVSKDQSFNWAKWGKEPLASSSSSRE